MESLVIFFQNTFFLFCQLFDTKSTSTDIISEGYIGFVKIFAAAIFTTRTQKEIVTLTNA